MTPILRNLETIDYHPTAKKLVQFIQARCKTSEELYFHTLTAYYFAKVASTMRVSVRSPEGNRLIPVNVYALNLAVSGFGKTKSMNIFEDEIIGLFKDRFLEETYPRISEDSIYKEGVRRAGRAGLDPDQEVQKLQAEFDDTGKYLFSFDSGTSPALKQMRHQLLLSRAGSLNFEVDEIGANLSNINEMLAVFLELYDVGKIKNKLVKNTSDNKRTSELFGSTPGNLLAFGTPTKLLNGAKNEEEFIAQMDQGYARRFLFAYVRAHQHIKRDPHEELKLYKTFNNSQFVCDLADQLMQLADQINFNKEIVMEDDVAIHWIAYQIHCDERANAMPDHAEILKTDMKHRHFKVMKLAAAYAFIDGEYRITEDTLYNAIKVAEESGKALNNIMSRERPYVKLAKYLAAAGTEVTQYELVEDLPFYKGTASVKQDLMNLAISWGYKNNVIIKKSYVDGIEFFEGESLVETDLDKMRFCYSTHQAFNYENTEQPFAQMSNLTQADGYHWVAHHVKNGHRTEENCESGFNMIVIDVDGGCSLDTAKLLLKKYTSLIYTTKSHTAQDNRFRVILPINYVLKLDSKEYKEFMANIFEALPFDSDEATAQRSRKWLANNGSFEYNYGELFDVLPFIPKTTHNETRQKAAEKLKNLSAVERWFVNTTGEGNRSNKLIRYASMLVDSGQTYDEVEEHVKTLNNKLADKLSDKEIMSTIMKTVTRKIIARDTKAA